MYCTGFWLVSLLRTMTLSLAVGSSLMPPESNRDFTLPWVDSAGPGPHRAQVPSKPAETGLRSIARGVRRISSRRRSSTQAGKPARTLQDDCGDQSTGGHDVCPLLAEFCLTEAEPKNSSGRLVDAGNWSWHSRQGGSLKLQGLKRLCNGPFPYIPLQPGKSRFIAPTVMVFSQLPSTCPCLAALSFGTQRPLAPRQARHGLRAQYRPPC